MKNVIVLVLGGGRGTRLRPLTTYRSKPAVPLGAKYRLIDIPLSNCINSGLRRMYVLTQFMSVSLHRHIRQTYNFDQFSGGFVEILAAQQSMDGSLDWYEGTADAVRKNLRYIQQPGIDYVLILSGDQLYRMDYREMLRTHQEADAAATIAAIPVSRQVASQLGIMRLGPSDQVQGFVEKPQTEKVLKPVLMGSEWFAQRGVQARGRECLASMGIYLFNRDLLVDVLKSNEYEDFGREVFPSLIEEERVQCHLFDGYWEDIGTIGAFYEANLALTREDAPFTLVSAEAPIYSRARFLPPARISGADVRHSLIGDGCQIAPGAVIENSVIGLRCQIGPDVTIRNSIVMGADMFETREMLADDRKADVPAIGIGRGSVISGAIVDKNCRIGERVHIENTRNLVDYDDDSRCVIRDRIPVIGKEVTLPDNWKLFD